MACKHNLILSVANIQHSNLIPYRTTPPQITQGQIQLKPILDQTTIDRPEQNRQK